jgi:hypothetical protein
MIRLAKSELIEQRANTDQPGGVMSFIAAYGPLPDELLRAGLTAQAQVLEAGSARLPPFNDLAQVTVHGSVRHLDFHVESWPDLSNAAKLARCATVVRWCRAIGSDNGAELTWIFSGLRLTAPALDECMNGWAATGILPAGLLIGIEGRPPQANASAYITRGLTAFVHQEVAVRVHRCDAERDALRDLLLIARHALAWGPMSDGDRLIGVRGPIAWRIESPASSAAYCFELLESRSETD